LELTRREAFVTEQREISVDFDWQFSDVHAGVHGNRSESGEYR
jgi:hypothetical protein